MKITMMIMMMMMELKMNPYLGDGKDLDHTTSQGMGVSNNNNNNNNDNNNLIQRRYSRFFTIFSQRRELSPTCTLKWPGRNRVQITCNTSNAYHVQVSCYVPLGTKGQLSY